MPRFAVQEELFGGPKLDQIINVSSVPKLSPFRYPGGKTWLIPRIRQWLKYLKNLPVEFVEPFAGGGIVSLSVANESLAAHIVMCELDESVAAVWKTVFSNDAEWLATRILSFDLTVEAVQRVLADQNPSTRELAFQTILKNRTFHGGILAPGSGLLKHGENGKGIRSRWYPETLKKRILAITSIRSRIDFVEGDGLELMSAKARQPETVFFIDPPYTGGSKKAGNRLYKHFELEHERLFRLASEVDGDVLMTYDDDAAIVDLAKKYHFDFELISMKNTHHAEMKELLIGKNLAWARR